MLLKFDHILVEPAQEDPDGIGSMSPCRDPPKIITSSSGGNLSTPNYPYYYPNNMDCQWHIQAGRKMAIKINILLFNLQNGYLKNMIIVFLKRKPNASISLFKADKL